MAKGHVTGKFIKKFTYKVHEMDAKLVSVSQMIVVFVRILDEMIIRKLQPTLDEILCKLTGRNITLKTLFRSFLNKFIISDIIQQTYQVLYSFACIYALVFSVSWYQGSYNHRKSSEKSSLDLSKDYQNR